MGVLSSNMHARECMCGHGFDPDAPLAMERGRMSANVAPSMEAERRTSSDDDAAFDCRCRITVTKMYDCRTQWSRNRAANRIGGVGFVWGSRWGLSLGGLLKGSLGDCLGLAGTGWARIEMHVSGPAASTAAVPQS